jgi:hypothetical protein
LVNASFESFFSSRAQACAQGLGMISLDSSISSQKWGDLLKLCPLFAVYIVVTLKVDTILITGLFPSFLEILA